MKIQAQEEQERRAGLQDEEGDEGSEEEERDTGDQVHRPQPGKLHPANTFFCTEKQVIMFPYYCVGYCFFQ